MNKQPLSNRFSVLAVALLLIVTAWGNALAMFIVAALGLVIGSWLFRGNLARGATLPAAAGFIVAIIIALVMWLSS